MLAKDMRAFVPCKDYEQSKAFYVALGFAVEAASDELSLCTNGDCTFFLQRFYNQTFAENLMFQLCVSNINDVNERLSKIDMTAFNAKYGPITQERWGKVLYCWGPSGELWHITELNEA